MGLPYLRMQGQVYTDFSVSEKGVIISYFCQFTFISLSSES